MDLATCIKQFIHSVSQDIGIFLHFFVNVVWCSFFVFSFRRKVVSISSFSNSFIFELIESNVRANTYLVQFKHSRALLPIKLLSSSQLVTFSLRPKYNSRCRCIDRVLPSIIYCSKYLIRFFVITLTQIIFLQN